MLKKIGIVLLYLIIFGVLGFVVFVRLSRGCDMITLH